MPTPNKIDVAELNELIRTSLNRAGISERDIVILSEHDPRIAGRVGSLLLTLQSDTEKWEVHGNIPSGLQMRLQQNPLGVFSITFGKDGGPTHIVNMGDSSPLILFVNSARQHLQAQNH
ncbi:hypothetical protein KC902_01730 [Candidatus Kaiserbacteria bacterium]|nr:hypothetical protein [Candidatus Kaiserbacteria bacterium]